MAVASASSGLPAAWTAEKRHSAMVAARRMWRSIDQTPGQSACRRRRARRRCRTRRLARNELPALRSLYEHMDDKQRTGACVSAATRWGATLARISRTVADYGHTLDVRHGAINSDSGVR